MPEIAAAYHEGRHITCSLDFLTCSDELIICLGLSDTELVEVCLIVDDTHCVLTCEGNGVDVTVIENHRGEEEVSELCGERSELACPYVHCSLASHLNDVWELADAVLCLDEFGVVTAVTGLDGNCHTWV